MKVCGNGVRVRRFSLTTERDHLELHSHGIKTYPHPVFWSMRSGACRLLVLLHITVLRRRGRSDTQHGCVCVMRARVCICVCVCMCARARARVFGIQIEPRAETPACQWTSRPVQNHHVGACYEGYIAWHPRSKTCCKLFALSKQQQNNLLHTMFTSDTMSMLAMSIFMPTATGAPKTKETTWRCK